MADVLCPVLIGREAELALLDGALRAALGGAGKLAFVTGEPGIGKSRLSRELAAAAAAAGAVVITGRAVPASQSTPYRPLTEALLQGLRDRPVATISADTELAPWLPALAAIVPVGVEPAGAVSQAQSAAVQAEAVLRLLRWLALPGGLVLVLEDLHWADPDTLAVLEYLGDNLGGERILCLATSRDEPATAVLESARRLHGRRAAEHLRLGRLASSQVADMVRACLPDPGDEVLGRVVRAADGVPFLVEEVLASPGVPASFLDTVGARLGALTAEQRHVLAAAAVLGRHFDWRLLAAVAGQPADAVTAALEHGVEQQLLTVVGGEFRFRHALTRDAVAATVLPPRRAALAAAALTVLAGAHPGLPGGYRDMAAELAVQAGDSQRAGTLLADSGADSLRRGALATAIDTLRRAAWLLGNDVARDRAEASLVEALALAGRIEEATAVGTGLIARLRDDPAAAQARAEVHLRLAHAAVSATRWTDARRQLAAAAGLLAPGPGEVPGPGVAVLEAEIAVLEAEVAIAAGNLDQARQLAERALATTAASPQIRCHALEIAGRSARQRDLRAAEEAFGQALEIAETAGLPFWRLRALHELGTIELFGHAGAVRLTQARQIADELGAMSTAAVIDLQLAAAADSRFELDELARWARDSLLISERLGLAGVRAKALLFLTEAYALRCDSQTAEHYAALAIAAAAGDPVAEAFVWGAGRAMLALLSDEQGAAMLAFERSTALLRDAPQAEPANFRGVRLLMLAATGAPNAADEIRTARETGVTASFANRGLADYAEAILAGRAGQAERAEELAAAGEGALSAYPVWSDLGRLHLAEAALAGQWGEPRRWLEIARESFAAHGLGRLARRCDRNLSADGQARWTPFGTTAREAEVLRLVAGGLSNKEIAARLFLSPRTVEKHVESLLRKTGARSRTQLATMAGAGREPGSRTT